MADKHSHDGISALRVPVRRREILKGSLVGGGAAMATALLGVPFATRARRDDTQPVVETKLGKLRGASANGVYFFKGVHYGTSTEDSMLFMPPVAPKPWTGVRDALEIGPPAPQDTSGANSTSEIRKAMGDLIGPGTMSEDCLVLHVWTPSLTHGSKRPVMVWLHGGGYTSGSAGVPLYDGTNLAGKHNVVLVGINHRLNVFGY